MSSGIDQPTGKPPTSYKIGFFDGPTRRVTIKSEITPDDLDALGAAICDAYLDLCTTLQRPWPHGIQFHELGEEGKNIWRAVARRGLQAIGVEFPVENGTIWIKAPDNSSER